MYDKKWSFLFCCGAFLKGKKVRRERNKNNKTRDFDVNFFFAKKEEEEKLFDHNHLRLELLKSQSF